LKEAVNPQPWIAVACVVEPWGLEGWIRVRAYGDSKATVLGKARTWRVAAHPGRSSARRVPDTQDLQILKLRPHAGCWLALPEGVNNRDKALELKGREILVRRSDFPRTPRGEYYWVDLIGCEVVNRAGETLGRVEKLEDHGAHPLLCVRWKADPETPSTIKPVHTASTEVLALAPSREDLAVAPLRGDLAAAPPREDLSAARLSDAPAEAACAPKLLLIPFVKHFVDRVDLEATRIHVDWQRDWS